MPQPRQPFLHDLVTVFSAPTQVLSDRNGDIDGRPDRPTAQGVLHADVRVLSRAAVRVDGQPGEHIATDLSGGRASFTSLLRQVGADQVGTPDPPVRLDRIREVQPGLVTERLTVSSLLAAPVDISVNVVFGSDLATLELIREGAEVPPQPFVADPDGAGIAWAGHEVSARLSAEGATLSLSADRTVLTASWSVIIPARGETAVSWQLIISDAGTAVVASPSRRGARPECVRSADHRLAPWLIRSLDDLDGMRMGTTAQPGDTFLGAGVPWYLTLFGRDSIWAARMLLPVDLGPAAGTLRALARLQGTKINTSTAEAPGKIPHELRRAAFELGGMTLPPLYYGTIDATPLWICLLHDAWRAGLGDAQVAELLPALESALTWLTEVADIDGDGFLEYLDASGRGLANQGWKDSADAIRFRDGRIAEGSVALCEVQGYAHEAAISGAALLEAFDRPGADRLRGWAANLADQFRAAFWCGTCDDRYPALALDGGKRRVDSLTSNIGHLLGTGLLNAEEERLVAIRVASDDLDSGLGLRTMSAADAGYAPLSYHCGSVWPHDTAIVIGGLHRAGLGEYAAGLIEGLLRASVAFDQRVPELWSGEGRPVPYPAACRPQAWSAASAVVVAQALEAL